MRNVKFALKMVVTGLAVIILMLSVCVLFTAAVGTLLGFYSR